MVFNRLQSILTSSPASGDILYLQYGYDSVGNITGITDAIDSNKNRTYTYDELNRLKLASSPSYGGNIIYQYDEIGNMTYNPKDGS